MSNFSNVVSPEEKNDIMVNYRIQERFDDNVLTVRNIETALQQALWVGFCRGRGWE